MAIGQVSEDTIITGKVIDQSTSRPIEFATVGLIDKTTLKLITGTVTDANGNFSIIAKTINVSIQISFIGYTTFTIKDFAVANNSVNLKTIQLKEDPTSLDEVVIKSEKTKLVNDFGKQILYVGSDIGSAGNSSLAILENFPSVVVGIQGEITVRGKNNVIIYINGKPTSKDGKSLKHLPADLVEKVELITNPSAEYGAEGVAGILNIILKKIKDKGFNLTANGTITALLNPLNMEYGTSFNTNYNFSKVNFFLNGGYSSTDYENSENSFQKCLTNDCDVLQYRYIQFEDGLQEDYDLNFGLLWNVSPISTLEIEGFYLKWDIEKDGLETNDFLYSTNQSENYELRNFGTSIKEEYEIALAYTTVWDTKDKLLLQLRYISDTWDRNFINNLDNIPLDNTPIENIIANNTSVDIDTDYLLDGKLTLKRDYGDWISGFVSQLSYNDLNQNIQYAASETLPTNDFGANSFKNALFTELQNDKGRLKWKLGFRLEHLSQNFTQEVDPVNVEKSYCNIFPSGLLEYKINDEHSTSISYSNRINYPRLTQLNPFIYFTSPLSLRKGNTALEPSKSHNIEVNYSHSKNKLKWSNSLFANLSRNLIRTQITTTNDGVNTQEPINDGNSLSAGYEFSLTVSPYKWLKLIQQGTLYYQEFSTSNASFNSQIAGRLRFFQELKFDKGWKIQLKESYRTPTINPQRKHLDEFYMDISVRKKFNKRLEFNLSFNDIFDTKRIAYERRTNEYIINETLNFQFQRIRFSISYQLKD
ncbi:MAG: TonB-dependent receptor [Flavobacteriaceae bacterium]